MTLTRRSLASLVALALAGLAGHAAAQTKWDLPAAYPATNFHSENLVQFADDVDKATGGKLKITVHAGASLFKAPEIKRAVQGGQAQIGEMLIANFQNEWATFGADGVALPGRQLRRSRQAVEGAEADAREEARRAGHDAAVRGAVAAAGHLLEEADQPAGRPEGREVARLQPGRPRASPNWWARSRSRCRPPR